MFNFGFVRVGDRVQFWLGESFHFDFTSNIQLDVTTTKLFRVGKNTPFL